MSRVLAESLQGRKNTLVETHLSRLGSWWMAPKVAIETLEAKQTVGVGDLAKKRSIVYEVQRWVGEEYRVSLSARTSEILYRLVSLRGVQRRLAPRTSFDFAIPPVTPDEAITN